MADLEEFPTGTDVSFPERGDTPMTEEVEQHGEEEVIHKVVSPDQTWTNDETVNHVDADNIVVEESSREVDEGMFLLDSEEEVKQKIPMYEKNTGTPHFIVLKKEKDYSQTEGEAMPSAFDGPVHIQASSLPLHEESHSCDDCEMVYKNYKSLWQHKRDNHQEKLQCGYCDYSSARMYNIRKHRQRRHPNMPDPYDMGELAGEPFPCDDDFDNGEPRSKLPRFFHSYDTEMANNIGAQLINSKLQSGASSATEMHQSVSPAGQAFPMILSAAPYNQNTSNQSLHVIRKEPSPTAAVSVLPRITGIAGSAASSTCPSSSTETLLHEASKQQAASTTTTQRREGQPEGRSLHYQASNNAVFSAVMGASVGQRKQQPTMVLQKDNSNGIAQRTTQSGLCMTSAGTSSGIGRLLNRQNRVAPTNQMGLDPDNWNGVYNKTPPVPKRTVSSLEKSVSEPTEPQHPWPNSRLASAVGRCSESANIITSAVHMEATNQKPANTCQPQPQSTQAQSQSAQPHPQSAQSHPQSTQSHPQSAQPQPKCAPSQNGAKSTQQYSCPPNRHATQPQQGSRISGQSQPRAKESVHFTTTVRGILDQYRHGEGLNDFKNLMQNFRVRSITERVVHPDGTRYEIQIEGEETDD